MFKHFLCQLFSDQCQLNSLRLDIGHYATEQFTIMATNSYENLTANQFQCSCTTLSRLYNTHIFLNILLNVVLLFNDSP